MTGSSQILPQKFKFIISPIYTDIESLNCQRNINKIYVKRPFYSGLLSLSCLKENYLILTLIFLFLFISLHKWCVILQIKNRNVEIVNEFSWGKRIFNESCLDNLVCLEYLRELVEKCRKNGVVFLELI